MSKEKKEKGNREISFSAQIRLNRLNINNVQPVKPEATDTVESQGTGARTIQHSENCIVMEHFLPARLVRTKTRWYISFYQTNPASGERERIRATYELGRIPIEFRLEYAKDKIKEINARLPLGYPFDENDYQKKVLENKISMSAAAALDLVLKLKQQTVRKESSDSYSSIINKFKKFLLEKEKLNGSIKAITEMVAIEYSDSITLKGLSGRSHNNDIRELRGFFKLLKKRKIIKKNPFKSIDLKKEEEKKRRPIPFAHRQIILDHLKENDVSVYLSVLMLYFCMIRPKEQRFIKIEQIELQNSIIRVYGTHSKNHKTQIVTIPNQFKEILIELRVDKLPSQLYILNSKTLLGKSTPVGKSLMSNRYRAIIQDLFQRGVLSNITGNQLYSWKDTGGDSMAMSIKNAKRMQNQFRHNSLSETEKYLSQQRSADKKVMVKHTL